MSIFVSDDPALDFARREAEEERWLATRPLCCVCNRPIQEDRLFDIDGNLYHEECAEDEFKKWSEDYML